MIKNNVIDLTEEDELCVCEDSSISDSERIAIDRVIEMYENGEFKESDFITWDEAERRLKALF